MITLPISDLLLLPGVTFFFKKDVFPSGEITAESVGEDILFMMEKEEKEQMTPDNFYPIVSLAGARHMHGGQAVGHGGHRRQTGPEGGDAVGEKVGILSLPRMDEGLAQAADAAEQILDRQGQAHLGMGLDPGQGKDDVAFQRHPERQLDLSPD